MYLTEKNVQCPFCKCILNVPNAKNAAERVIHCPKCHNTLKVSFADPMAQPPQPGATVYGPQQGAGGGPGATELPGSAPGLPKHPAILFQGRRYPLIEGANIIGRKATASPAHIQLPSTDVYLSRQHAVITVQYLPGGQPHVEFAVYKAKNATYVQNQLIVEGDRVALQNFMEIRMADTVVTYVED